MAVTELLCAEGDNVPLFTVAYASGAVGLLDLAFSPRDCEGVPRKPGQPDRASALALACRDLTRQRERRDFPAIGYIDQGNVDGA